MNFYGGIKIIFGERVLVGLLVCAGKRAALVWHEAGVTKASVSTITLMFAPVCDWGLTFSDNTGRRTWLGF